MQQFLGQVAALAQRYGVKTIVIALRDPQSGDATVQTSPGALDDLRPILVEKLGVSNLGGADDADAMTGWPSG